MDLKDRRRLLRVSPNPDRGLDYIVTLSGSVQQDASQNQPRRQIIELRYIPDKFILDSRAFAHYLNALTPVTWPTPEDLAVTVLTDLNNEIICRWLQVALTMPSMPNTGLEHYEILIEDRQPGWDNARLLARLPHI